MIRFLSKDLLSGLMFIGFGVIALYFGQKLALGTPVRMGPGFVPHMLAYILLSLGSVIALGTLFRTADKKEKERYWIPVAALSLVVLVFSLIPWGSAFIANNVLGPESQQTFKTMSVPFMVASILVADVVILMLLVSLFGRPGAEAEDLVEMPKWKPITMVTIGIICFALLFERAGLIPALVALILIASLGGEEFKLTEVIGNMIVLSVLCTLVFKVGLQMNITIVHGIW
ncbi:tripartite tricarboxylate transporter TctB family protein [Reyranella sp.]|uniref:tripartite tricarboxylate transporter TctB family protein n=1 Tax=Reyranella sp. TaxID=1929291 RepID=UPI003BA85E1B